MENVEKYEKIREWVGPEERVTVDFRDEKNLDAEITSCNAEHVEISIDTKFPYLKQTLSIPLGEVELAVDRTKYTRNPNKPIRYERLRMVVNLNRQQWV